MLKIFVKSIFKLTSSNLKVNSEYTINTKRRKNLRNACNFTLITLLVKKSLASVTQYFGDLPDIGDSDRTSISPSEATFLGKQVIAQITADNDMVTDYDALTYLNNLGNTLVSYSPLAGQIFSFYLIKDKQINAFALPGGYICIYNGLIFTTQSEAELVSVMAHEIGHIVQHHIFRNIAAYNRNQWLSLAAILAGGLLATVNPAAGIVAADSGQGLAIQNMLAFSRDFEREADRVGQQIMYQAGFDPTAMPVFFQRLQDANKFNDSGAYEFLRTHPVTSSRISEAQNRSRNWHVKMRPDSVSFLLIREKCRTRQLGALIAINFYQQSLLDKKYSNLQAQYYGLAYANYISQNFNEASKSLAHISDIGFINNPIVLSLKGQILTATKNYQAASKVYAEALGDYPTYKPLWLGEVDVYLNSKQYAKAIIRLDSLSKQYADDIDVWRRIASLYADTTLNNPQKYFYALGNISYLQANYQVALDQYQLAIQIKSGDETLNDIITAKIIDTKGQIKYKAQFTN